MQFVVNLELLHGFHLMEMKRGFVLSVNTVAVYGILWIISLVFCSHKVHFWRLKKFLLKQTYCFEIWLSSRMS